MLDLNHIFGRISIRTKLLILTLGLATVPLLLYFGLSIGLGFFEMKEMALRNLEQEAMSIRNRIEMQLVKFSQDVRYLGSSPFLDDYIRHLGTRKEKRYRWEALQNLIRFSGANSVYNQLRYIDENGLERLRVDRKGKEVKVTPAYMLQDKSQRYYFQEAIVLNPGEIYVSPMDYNVEHGKVELPKLPVFRFAYRVVSAGQLRGVFVLNVFGQTILDILNAGVEAKPSYLSLSLLDEQQRVIVSSIDNQGQPRLSLHLDEKLHLPDSTMKKLLSSDWDQWNATDRKFYVRMPINPEGVINASQWTLVLEGDRDAFMEPIFRFGNYSLMFLIFFSLAGIFLGLAAARHFYRPLIQLMRGARKVAQGEYNVEIAFSSNDELEDLSRDFSMMAGSLESREKEIQKHQSELESLVKKRTFQIALEKEKLERLVEGVGAGMVLMDKKHHVVWSNEHFNQMVGADTLENGETCCDIFSRKLPLCGAGDKNGRNCQIKKVFKGQEAEHPLRELTCADGEKRVYLDRISPVHDEKGIISYVLHVLYDVTEKHRMEEREEWLKQQLVRAEKLATLGRYTSGIAHEIGNPLGIISTNAQSLQEDFSENSVQWRQLDLIISEIHRLSKITKDLNTFGKPSPPNMLSQNPLDIINGLYRLIEKEATAHGVRLIMDITPIEGIIRVDAQQLQQVILNLTLNAFEAMPNGGELRLGVKTVETARKERWLQFAFSDTGVGIPPENLEAIFDPFFTTKPQGTGFGLALANTIIHQNMGELFVESTFGKGATFTISFPLVGTSPVGKDAHKPESTRLDAPASGD